MPFSTITAARPATALPRLACAVLLALALAALASSSATAAVRQLSCAGTQSSNFSPGLTNTPATTTVSYRAILAPCVSLTDPTVTAGTYSGSFVRVASCTSLLSSPAGRRTLNWTNGRSSVFEFTSTATYAAGQLVTTLTGAITSGAFAGSTAIQTLTAVADLTQCAAPGGVSSLFGAVQLQIVL